MLFFCQVTDTKLPIGPRLATFDGRVRHVTTTSLVNQNLFARTETLSASMAQRIDSLYPGSKVWRLQLNLKPCADGLVRLIWCSKLVQEATDAGGFVADLQENLESPSIASNSSSVYATGGSKYQAPLARSWHGGVTPCDGSIFHMPLPGMTTFREPSWWKADHSISIGVTNPLPSPQKPVEHATPISRGWRVHEVQERIYAGAQSPSANKSSMVLLQGVDEDIPDSIESFPEGIMVATTGKGTSIANEGTKATADAVDEVAEELASDDAQLSDAQPQALTARPTDRTLRLPRLHRGVVPPSDYTVKSDPAMPKSMVRAVRMYQHDERPSGLFKPKWVGSVRSPRDARLAALSLSPRG